MAFWLLETTEERSKLEVPCHVETVCGSSLSVYLSVLIAMLETMPGNKRYSVLFAFILIALTVVVCYRYLSFGNTLNVSFSTQSVDNKLSWNGVLTHKNSLVDWKSVDILRKLPKSVDWSTIKRRKTPEKADMHDKWIVVTSIAAPTEDVRLLSKIPGWKLLVVGDKKTPKSWR